MTRARIVVETTGSPLSELTRAMVLYRPLSHNEVMLFMRRTAIVTRESAESETVPLLSPVQCSARVVSQNAL